MSPHDLIKAAMTGLKKPRVPHLTARRARRGTPGGPYQVPANPD